MLHLSFTSFEVHLTALVLLKAPSCSFKFFQVPWDLLLSLKTGHKSTAVSLFLQCSFRVTTSHRHLKELQWSPSLVQHKFVNVFTSLVNHGTFCSLTLTWIFGAWDSGASVKSCWKESQEASTSEKEFSKDHGTLFRSWKKTVMKMFEISGLNYPQGRQFQAMKFLIAKLQNDHWN